MGYITPEQAEQMKKEIAERKRKLSDINKNNKEEE